MEKLDAAVSAGDVSGIIGLQGALKFNGGGHLNHTLFWENLCPQGSAGNAFPTSGPLKDAVDARFGGFDAMKKEVSAMTVGVQGSGWGWLGLDAKTGKIFFCVVVSWCTFCLDSLTQQVTLTGITIFMRCCHLIIH
jgi:Fe-Mn family superoxide dismutase